MTKFALAIHGGCGVMAKLDLSEAEWIAARRDLGRALKAGYAVLESGGNAIDAVQAAVVIMEDSPHFNAGHGAALNENAIHELDASIMDGKTLAAGAICASRRIRNPVLAARAVLENGDMVMLAGPAADRFAEAKGLAVEEQAYFTTERRKQALAAMKAHVAAGTQIAASESEKHGTVGAVALDQHGHLAAATSTGGYNNKPDGRIGDSPVIGAGTYARDGVCAVSGTGKGEFFIRHVVGHEVAARVAYLGEDVRTASEKVIIEDMKPHQIGAGLVAVGADGTVAAPYNTDGMFRGWVTENGDFYVASHAEVMALSDD
ncbi:beta-aspartyl-peptidase (threonine type) [Ensifer sp. KUDG1]|uniref:isoaspartyl peptidase/L-asparaginase family protein n=1 Tax=Ensifer sp. KUDG1 TaxID=3373919 RepID=UPI003D221145